VAFEGGGRALQYTRNDQRESLSAQRDLTSDQRSDVHQYMRGTNSSSEGVNLDIA
jgi:hypothetical protein